MSSRQSAQAASDSLVVISLVVSKRDAHRLIFAAAHRIPSIVHPETATVDNRRDRRWTGDRRAKAALRAISCTARPGGQAPLQESEDRAEHAGHSWRAEARAAIKRRLESGDIQASSCDVCGGPGDPKLTYNDADETVELEWRCYPCQKAVRGWLDLEAATQ